MKIYTLMAAAVILSGAFQTGKDLFFDARVQPTDLKKETYLPLNNRRIAAGSAEANPMTRGLFHRLIDRVERVYQPEYRKYGLVLNTQRHWRDDTVNAFAWPPQNGVARVELFGGLARHPDITPDGFTLVLCHEVGHHIGGAPKRITAGLTWATSEGQADYFATLKCARRLWRKDDNVSLIKRRKKGAHFDYIYNVCRRAHRHYQEEALCMRSALAAISLAKVLQDVTGKRYHPRFKDRNFVAQTITETYPPTTQCRLDTYFAGAVCPISGAAPVSPQNPFQGTCSHQKGARYGFRPRCWFHPQRL